MTIVQVLFSFPCETFFKKCLQNSAAKLYLIRECVLLRSWTKCNSIIRIFQRIFHYISYHLCRSNMIDLILNQNHFHTYVVVVCHSNTFWIFDAFFSNSRTFWEHPLMFTFNLHMVWYLRKKAGGEDCHLMDFQPFFDLDLWLQQYK